MAFGGRVGALWIGGLEPYMDELFLQNAMNMMGEIGVVSIKVMTNKFTGEPSGYGFINFDSDQTAIIAMHRLGGKIIPHSNPPVRFKLNHNSTRLQPGETDTSIWVGDLTRGARDALRTTHQNQYNFFQGSFSSSTQHQRDIQSKISHQNNIIETSSLKLIINEILVKFPTINSKSWLTILLSRRESVR